MERPPQNFAGRVAIVTGAAKGLGRAYAEYLAARGAKVIVNNRRRANALPGQTADDVVEIIRDAGGMAIASTHDVGDPASGEAMVALALETYGRLDILVNNAGVPEGKPFAKMSVEEFRSVFDINFFGHLYVTHAAFKAMTKASYGRIVISTSSAGLHANHGMPAYSSSKAGLIGLMRSLALEGFKRGVRVNAIAPYAETTMTEGYMPEHLKDRLPPRDVAPVVAWLADEACPLNGEILVAGGGVVRRAAMTEGAGIVAENPLALTPELLTHNLSALTDMSAAREHANATESFIEMFSAKAARPIA